MIYYYAYDASGQQLYKSTAPFAEDWRAANGYRMEVSDDAQDTDEVSQ